MIGKKGGAQPKELRPAKKDHITVTLCGPAEGDFMKFLFTFSGVEDKKDMCEGAPNSMWQRTSDGWADATTWVLFAHELVAEKKKRGLDKILLFIDNAAVHLSFEVIRLFIDNKIQLFGLIPSGTGWQQPLDVGYIGYIKKSMERVAKRMKVKVMEETLALIWEATHKNLAARRRDKGRSVLAVGFKRAGLVPFNPAKFGESAFRGSDALLGIKPGADTDNEMKAARERGKAMAAVIVKEAVETWQPESRAALDKLADDETKARRDKWLAEHKGKGEFDPRTGVARMLYTSASFVLASSAKAAIKAAEAEAKAAAPGIRAAKKAAREAAAEALKKEKAAARAAKAAALAAEKASRGAKRVARAPAAAAAPERKVGAKARSEDEPSYEKQYSKRVRT